MAEKHKSKYKAPKDLEKSQKPKPRKDLKDYSEDDKKGALNPKSTGEKQSNVLRKTDKEVIDTGDMFVKYNADDRLYKDLEDGEYDPKHAAKVLKKRQDADEKDNAKNIKDKIENLTREGKERFIREYVRRKINILLEQPTAEEPNAEETPEEAPADPAATTPDASATVPDAPEAPAATTPEAPATDAPAQPTPEETEGRAITAAATEMATEGGYGKIKMIDKMLNIALKETDPEDQLSFYAMLRSYAIKKRGKIQTK